MAYEPTGSPRTPEDLPAADLVHIWLNRGRDNARPIGELAEMLKLTRRQVEQAVQELRLREWPVCSGPEGVWLGDRADLEQTVESLRGRLRTQYRTYLALRKALKRQAGYEQQDLGLVA